MRAEIRAVAYHVPDGLLTNDALAADFPDWPADKILEKTGIRTRHIAAPEECASDLGVAAAQRLFAQGACTPADVDYVLFCTQAPDYFLPTTACLVQERLGIPRAAGALDINLGCSGYVYGLGLAKGLVETGQARRVLLITADTYSKFINPRDKSVRTLFGDGAAATLVAAGEGDEPAIGPFVYGTDGRGAPNLIVPTGGMRRREPTREVICDETGPVRTADDLFMNGPEIFAFTLAAVPKLVGDLLQRAGVRQDDVGLFVFHQANKFMLDHLRKKLKIAPERFALALEPFGNTVSSTIPITLAEVARGGGLHAGDRVMLVGFGVGYSWGACLARWTA